jgi:hypothetical protein
MAIIARLAGEGIGPFKSFDFDFSDARGNPHPGPHIFAGINGSGKSTILRTLAWLLESDPSEGFQWQEWQHLIQGYGCTRAMMVLLLPGLGAFVVAETMDTRGDWAKRLHRWVKELLAVGRIESLKGELPIFFQNVWPREKPGASVHASLRGRWPRGYLTIGDLEIFSWVDYVIAAGYGPSRLLKHLADVNLSVHLKEFRENALSFEATVQNEAIQSWLLGLFSKRAIAKERGENMSKYSAALGRFEDALRLICGQQVQFGVDIEPSLQPRLLMYQKKLDFSQLPDGVRSTVGWLADFLMRMDMHESRRETNGIHLPPHMHGLPTRFEREGILLLDEVDAHLHPKWQRSILPAIKRPSRRSKSLPLLIHLLSSRHVREPASMC